MKFMFSEVEIHVIKYYYGFVKAGKYFLWAKGILVP